MGNESAKANCSPLRRRPYRPAPRERPGAASGVTSSVVRHVWPLRGEPTMTRQFSTAISSSQILVPRSCGTLMLHPPRTELRCQFFDWVGAVVSRVRAWACLCRRIRRAQWIIAGLIDLAINNLSRNRRRCVLAPFRLRDGASETPAVTAGGSGKESDIIRYRLQGEMRPSVATYSGGGSNEPLTWRPPAGQRRRRRLPPNRFRQMTHSEAQKQPRQRQRGHAQGAVAAASTSGRGDRCAGRPVVPEVPCLWRTRR